MWKGNWDQTRRRMTDWWNRRGLVLGMWGAPDAGRAVHEAVEPPPTAATWEQHYCDPDVRAARNHYRNSRSNFPLDMLPLAITDLGPGSLALLLGSTPQFSRSTVWFDPTIEDLPDPEALPPFRFDPANRWWQVTEAILLRCAERARDRYIVSCPDLVENIDTLCSLRGMETVCMDMLERPAWVEQKVHEINDVWFAAYQRIYDIIKMPDGSSAFGAFYLWGPGKVAKVQCDASALISPAMYRRFVVPALTEQCAWLDHSLYHLDGTQAIVHLDALLEIEALDAIEWTPQAGVESGGHSRWYDLYRRILTAGKSVQVVGVKPDEVVPLLDAVGHQGVYIMMQFKSEQEAEAIRTRIAPYYPRPT